MSNINKINFRNQDSTYERIELRKKDGLINGIKNVFTFIFNTLNPFVVKVDNYWINRNFFYVDGLNIFESDHESDAVSNNKIMKINEFATDVLIGKSKIVDSLKNKELKEEEVLLEYSFLAEGARKIVSKGKLITIKEGNSLRVKEVAISKIEKNVRGLDDNIIINKEIIDLTKEEGIESGIQLPMIKYRKNNDGSGYILNYFYNCGDLGSDHKKKFNYIEKINIIKYVSKGLRSLHEKGIVHGDIKPGNILVTTHNNKKIGALSDFETLGYSGKKTTYFGTKKYNSPRLKSISRESSYSLSKKDDMFSMGITIFKIFSHLDSYKLDKIITLIRSEDGIKKENEEKFVKILFPPGSEWDFVNINIKNAIIGCLRQRESRISADKLNSYMNFASFTSQMALSDAAFIENLISKS